MSREAGVAGPEVLSVRRRAWDRFRENRAAVVGLGVLVVLGAAALLAGALAPFDPTEPVARAAGRPLPPSGEHLLGTDRFGRDVLSRVIHGARVSVPVAVLAAALAAFLGAVVGAVAGYAGGLTDAVAMRGVDLLLSFPRIVILVVAAAIFSPSLMLVVLLLGFTGWMETARLVRGEVLSIREREYVQAARILGYGHGRILLRHVLPNAASPLLVAAALGAGDAILAEAALSFLGLGVQPPAPSWGAMVADGTTTLVSGWWAVLFPGVAIALAVVAFNLVADGFRDALQPRSRPPGGMR